MLFTGPLSSVGAPGNGFFKVPSQPDGDNRPYLQLMLFGFLFGMDPDYFDETGHKWGFDRKVHSNREF